MSVIDSIMALEVKETCGTTHRAYWSYKWYPFTAVINCTCSTGFDCKISLLSIDHLSWLFRVRVPGVIFTNFEKLWLSRRAGILAPQSFEIDSADITASWSTWKGSIDLFQIICCEDSVILITAYIIAKIFFTDLGGVVDSKGIAII